MWYKRSEAQKRYTIFFSSTQLAGAFGGLLAAAIGNMNGLRGFHAWRWIFILEGTLTCVIAFLAFFMITDFPEDAKWLREDERDYIKSRLLAEQGSSTTDLRITIHDTFEVFKDHKTYLGGVMYFSLAVPAYSMQIVGCFEESRVADMQSLQALPISLPPLLKHTDTVRLRRSSTPFHLLSRPSVFLYSWQFSPI